MSDADHVPGELLVRALDGEVTAEESARVTSHLAECSACQDAIGHLRNASAFVESMLNQMPVTEQLGEREQLRQRMAAIESDRAVGYSPGKVMRRFGLGMALAATLAIGIIVAPRQKLGHEELSEPATQQADAFEVDGETFVALPYSNPDLPVNAQRIVRMQVPLSTLTDVGIVLEPISSRVAEQDASVTADVLVGTDGQPVGVHVLSSE